MVELYSGFSCRTYDPSGCLTTSIAWNAARERFIIDSSMAVVRGRDSVPDARMSSSMRMGLPDE